VDDDVDEVVGAARSLLPRLQRAMLEGTYQQATSAGLDSQAWGRPTRAGHPEVIDRWFNRPCSSAGADFEPTFHNSSHGFRPSRGAHTAIAQAKRTLAKVEVVVDLDLSKFFDASITSDCLVGGPTDRGPSPPEADRQMLKAKVVMPAARGGYRRGAPRRSSVADPFQCRPR
jgi:hypothetical protein